MNTVMDIVWLIAICLMLVFGFFAVSGFLTAAEYAINGRLATANGMSALAIALVTTMLSIASRLVSKWAARKMELKAAQKEREARQAVVRERQEAEDRYAAAAAVRASLAAHDNKEKLAKTQRKHLVEACDRSIAELETLSNRIDRAECCLDRARTHFRERAFSPFWENIEVAALSLAEAHSASNAIVRASTTYTELATKVPPPIPAFPVKAESARSMATGARTGARLREVVAAAQKDFEFSTIYEQRRTTSAVISGFRNLADAVDNLGWKIQDSVDDLGRQLTGSLQELGQSIGARIDSIGDRIETSGARAASHLEAIERAVDVGSRELSARHDKAIEMLNNIQRRRYPLSPELRGPSY